MAKLSIIIPCYNEAGNISVLIDRLETIKIADTEVILVNNGSTDHTDSVLADELVNKHPYIRCVSINQNIGYGHGIMTGIKEATGDVIAWTHADLQTDPMDVINAYSVYINNSDIENCVLKGRRFGRNIFDTFFTFSMGLLSLFLMKVHLTDINAQPKMFHRSFLLKMGRAPNDFSLDLYFLYQARIKGYKILEYPVHFGKRLHGEAKGGGTLSGKWTLIKRTWLYMNRLKNKFD